MPDIYCHDSDTDRILIDQVLAGHVVGLDGTDYQVIGSGRTADGVLTIEAHAWDHDKGAPITTKVVEVDYYDIDVIEVYGRSIWTTPSPAPVTVPNDGQTA